jgi:hypothetical protein
MLVKASFAAGALICAAVAFSSVNFRQLYNEMYPVNGLRRDVLNLCHEAEPTFIRAIDADRIGCYDSMPDPVELAIGWVRTSSRLAAMHKPTPVEVAERLLVAAIREHRLDRLGLPQFSGYAMVTGGAAYGCDDGKGATIVAAKSDLAGALPDDSLVLRLARGDRGAMAALGLRPPRNRPAAALPVLSLGGAGSSDGPGISEGSASLADPAPAAEAGGDGVPLHPSLAAAATCRTPT